MFSPDELSRYADILLWGIRKARLEPYSRGDAIQVRFDPAAMNLAEFLHARILSQGLNPIMRFTSTPTMDVDFYSISGEDQLTFIPAGERELYNTLHGSITLLAPESLTHLKDTDPRKIAKTIISRKKLREILEKREQDGKFGWSLCLCPTAELARQAGLTPSEYKDQIVKACYLDVEDPVREWEAIFARAEEIKKWLNSLDIYSIRLVSPHMNLRVRLGEQRRWLGVSGHNLPSFEIFTSPDWRGTEGTYYADQPSFRSGNLVKGVRLSFKEGKVVDLSADEGEAFLRTQVELDPGAGCIGEFSLTDRRFSRISRFMAHTLYDENYGGDFGNCHIALGASYGDTYSGDQKTFSKKVKKELGFNDSALHWDLVNTEKKEVWAEQRNGKEQLIYKDGEFQSSGS